MAFAELRCRTLKNGKYRSSLLDSSWPVTLGKPPLYIGLHFIDLAMFDGKGFAEFAGFFLASSVVA
jgi:hypothetical protein